MGNEEVDGMVNCDGKRISMIERKEVTRLHVDVDWTQLPDT